jgi:hypothetical protein
VIKSATAIEKKRKYARERARVERAKNPELVRQRLKDWYANNKDWAKNYSRRPDVVRRLFERHLKSRYGITLEDFARLEHAQNRLCAGCLDPLEHGKKLHIDHCHATGTVRGLLCQRCNHALGMVRDNAAILARLIAYLGAK